MSSSTTTPVVLPPPTSSPPPTPSQTPPTATTSTNTPTQPTTTSSTPPIIIPPISNGPTSTSTSTSTSLPTTTSSTSVLTTTSISSVTPTTPATPTTPGQVITTTSIITLPTSPNIAAPTNSADGSNTSSSSGFFNNKGAVAGVFTVVGLIVLAILIALITNGIRRRRARKFDEEIAAAARDAANAQVPNFAYDDDDDFRPGVYGIHGGNGTKFSDASHGTYAQPPMSVPESYGMRELPNHGSGPGVGEYFDGGNYGPPGAAGAAGIGVARARSMRDGAYAAGLKEGASPYAAFAVPGPNSGRNGGSPPQYPPGMIRAAGSPEFDLSRRPSQYTQQTDLSALSRNKSLGTTVSSAPSYQTEPYHAHNGGYGQAQGYPNSFGAYANGTPSGAGSNTAGGGHPAIPASRSEENLDSAYDGYVMDEPAQISHPTNGHGKGSASPPPGPLPNPFGTGKSAEGGDETDDEIEEPRRVLKVANE